MTKCIMCNNETSEKAKFDDGEEHFICEYCKDEIIWDTHAGQEIREQEEAEGEGW